MSWRRFLKRRWWDEERAREIAAYLENETADNIVRGMPPAEAAAAARRKFGNPGLVREEIYRMNTIGWLESTWQDLRYGVRTLRLRSLGKISWTFSPKHFKLNVWLRSPRSVSYTHLTLPTTPYV